jgi:chaperonin GroEL
MSKSLLYNTEARRKLKAGVDEVGDAVRVTMGHKGRVVVIDRATPIFTLDGVTVAQAIEKLEDPVENMGADIVKGVAQKTNDEAGDGTTTATLLTQSLLHEGLKGIEQGIDPITLKSALNSGMDVILKHLKANSKPVKEKEQMKSVATISSRDSEVGEIIANIYSEIGKDGIIATEEMKQVGMNYEIVEGMEIDSGWAAPHFMTNRERQEAVINNPYILVTSQNIRTNEDIVPILSKVLEKSDSKALVIIADDCVGEALATLIINKLRGVAQTLVIKSPGYGDTKKEYLQDICAITGAEHLTEETATRVENATLEQLGRADKVVAYKGRTIIVGGKGKKNNISERIAQVTNELKDTVSKYKKESLTKRLAKLKGGVAVIRVGDYTEEASREKQYRIEDAINSTKSAIEEGVVIGGGLALYNASKELDKLIDKEKNPDFRFGLQALQKAIIRPAYQILENEGRNPEAVIALGYSLPENIIDPLKVERVALQQAVSVVGLFLTTEAVVFEKPEDKKPEPKPLR